MLILSLILFQIKIKFKKFDLKFDFFNKFILTSES